MRSPAIDTAGKKNVGATAAALASLAGIIQIHVVSIDFSIIVTAVSPAGPVSAYIEI
jgi:hypothetical protein